MEEIRVDLAQDICLLLTSLEEGLTEEVIKFVAERDDKLLESYLEGEYNK
ncbi:hypothetical protein [Halonatronum saccharophilum]|nr:hypothetical protein [Halonatronum saccharophilum]